jgi:DNA adenine methylase
MAIDTCAVVNVSQIKKLSPFRYPGGKTWLVPHIRAWLSANPSRELIEPFAGGGIVSLTAVFEGLVDCATMVEMDADVAAVWETIFSDDGGADWLAERIVSFKLTGHSVERILARNYSDVWEQAFATILKNRCQRGGIMANGAGLLKEGENGKGLLSRWYPETLAKRIRAIAERREQFNFIRGDAFAVLRDNVRRTTIAAFIDPPYTVAAKRLYNHWQVDHPKLFAVAGQLRGTFLMTNDATAEVRELAETNGFQVRPVPMKNTHHEVMEELLIGGNLEWLG